MNYDEYYNILLCTDINDIKSMCMTNTFINNICNDFTFKKNKLIYDGVLLKQGCIIDNKRALFENIFKILPKKIQKNYNNLENKSNYYSLHSCIILPDKHILIRLLATNNLPKRYIALQQVITYNEWINLLFKIYLYYGDTIYNMNRV